MRCLFETSNRGPVGANPTWPGVSPPGPVASLATDAATRSAKRRQASVWAGGVGLEIYAIPDAESAVLLEGDGGGPAIGRGTAPFGGVFVSGTHEQDRPVTREVRVLL